MGWAAIHLQIEKILSPSDAWELAQTGGRKDKDNAICEKPVAQIIIVYLVNGNS